MLDIKRIKDDPEAVKAGLRAKEVDCDAAVDRILELDAQRRALILSTETDKAEQNRVSKEIPKRKKAGEDVAPIFARMAELKAQIAQNDQKLTDVEAEYRTLMLSLPNLPDPDLKPGRCATTASRITSTSSRSTMWTCARTSASSTMSAARVWRAPASGSTAAWARASSGPCSTTSSTST